MQKLTKVLRYSVIGGLFIAPFIPLVVADFLFFPFITGKNFLFRILVEIIFGLWVILAIYDKRYRLRKSWIFIFLLAFVVVSAISTIFGENAYRSFWSNYERMEGLITYLHLLAYFLVIASVFRTEKIWKWFFHASLFAAVIVSVYAILQFFGKLAVHQGTVRLDATLGNASYLAVYMLFHIFLAIFYFFKEKSNYRWIYAGLAVLFSFILYNTATRGTILGAVGGLFLMALIISLLSANRKAKIFALAAILLILASVGVFFAFKSSDLVRQSPVLSRFADISFEEQTTQSRFVIWKMGWEGFKEKPLLGWGPENFNLVFNKYYEPILWRQEPWFDRAHNVFLDRLTATGIFGLLAYLGLFASAAYYLLLKRAKHGFSVQESAVLTSLLAAYFFHNLFVFDNIVSFILFFSILGYIHFRATAHDDESGAPARPESDYRKSALSAVVAVLIVFVLYFANVPGLLACNGLLGAFKQNALGDPDGSFDSFKGAIAYDSFGTPEAREHLVNFATKVLPHGGLEAGFKQEVFEEASREMEKQIESSSGDIRYMIFLASLYNKAGQHENAIGVLEKAIEFSPKKQQLYFEMTSSYINKGEYKRAMEIARVPFELDMSFDDARLVYATASIYAGEIGLAEDILKERFGTSAVADMRILNAYNFQRQFDKTTLILEEFVRQYPDNAQYKINLAASYLETGERQKAIEQLEMAIKLNPAFKSQGEYYINEIKAGRNP